MKKTLEYLMLINIEFKWHSFEKICFKLILIFFIFFSGLANAQNSDNELLLNISSIIAAIKVKTKGIVPPSGGFCEVPRDAKEEDVSLSDNVVGNGTASSCTSEAVVTAVAKGGIITFNCGDAPIEITMQETAKIFNNTGPKIVIDGGDKVTLNGNGKRRILYMNTCDQNQVWTTPHCQNQDHPQLTVQNIKFVNANSKAETEFDGGGAIWVRGGRFKMINTSFENNVCADTGPDLGGGAVRVLSQYQGLPVYITNSVFGGAFDKGNVCSNGGALSSIGVSFSIYNSVFSYNKAIGNGANPAQTGTLGGGSGGVIYNDGNKFDLQICGTTINDNTANEGGSAIFFVSNDRTGTLTIEKSDLLNNVKGEFETAGYPGIFYLGNGAPNIVDSILR